MAVAFQDYYEALEVPRDASEQDIRRSYRRLARRYHPDINKEPGAEDRFKQISEAYEVLRDKDKRAQYDRFGENWKAGQDVSAAGGFEGYRGGPGFPGGGDALRRRARRLRQRRLQRLLRGAVRPAGPPSR